jgi:hypothetical protein
VRTATAAVVTSVATIAIGGMLAFCRADGPPVTDGEEAARTTANPSASAETAAGVVSEGQPPSPAVRRWGEPAPEPLPQASAIAAELAAIRERVGTAVPSDWQAFGVSAAAGEEAGFEKSIETLEADDAPSAATPGAASVPPTLADSEMDGGRGIPFKPSFEPFPGEWEMGPEPGPSPYFPPHAEILPFESPEALGELTKLVSATARDLERMAHVREEQRRYEDADRLRRLAMQLRRENRRLLPEPTANPAYPGPSIGKR